MSRSTSVPFFAVIGFLMFVLIGAQWVVVSTLDQVKSEEMKSEVAHKRSEVAQHQGLPDLFAVMGLPEAEARATLAQGRLDSLQYLDPDKPTKVTVSETSPFSIQLGHLSWDGACPLVLAYLRAHPEMRTATHLSFNGVPIASEAQMADVSCGGQGSQSTLRVTAH
jgi:hypothetical protein